MSPAQMSRSISVERTPLDAPPIQVWKAIHITSPT
jgi:hypothetical protein